MTFEQIINEPTLTLVDFFATWCGPCKAMMPALETLKDEMGEQIRIIKIDVDKNTDLAVAQKVMGVPTLALFKDGKELWRQAGVMTAPGLKALVLKYS
ncbi:MAG: thioredoxin [Bacteroidota bacterium]|jgi:thioredoxin 1